jgi:hypothetical protein
VGLAGGRLGFEVHELPRNFRSALVHYFMTGLDAVYHPRGLDRLDGKARKRWPVELWLSSSRIAELARR